MEKGILVSWILHITAPTCRNALKNQDDGVRGDSVVHRVPARSFALETVENKNKGMYEEFFSRTTCSVHFTGAYISFRTLPPKND